METICSTGIRVSEVKYITVEAVRQGKAEIVLKGKVRVILLSSKLCRKLLNYARKQKTASGAIFRTRSGRELGRRQIWAELKGLCGSAGVEPSKVFPHNLRHLFATVFYKACRDIVRLADVLGHSSIETTRIYLVTSGREHRRQLERLGLVSKTKSTFCLRSKLCFQNSAGCFLHNLEKLYHNLPGNAMQIPGFDNKNSNRKTSVFCGLLQCTPRRPFFGKNRLFLLRFLSRKQKMRF